MKIGILTYHWVSNFGANLQTLSTVNYFKKKGYNPLVINWVPYDLEKAYVKNTKNIQLKEHKQFGSMYLPMSRICRNKQDIANVIKEENIEAMVLGSDAIFSYLPILSRIRPSRHKYWIYTQPYADRKFPNPFWGDFLDIIDIPTVILSASAQNFNFLQVKLSFRKKQFAKHIRRFKYISVRDVWTNKMVQHFASDLSPSVTPDPVFAFNNNAQVAYLTKQDILAKYNLPENYVLISVNGDIFHADKVNALSKRFKENGALLIEIPRANQVSNLSIEKRIDLPIPPIDWYYLIKYSFGYIGELMHPIIVSLHNSVPFFSFDTYGYSKDGTLNKDSSKIYQILNRFDMLDNYYNKLLNKSVPNVDAIYEAIMNFDKEKCSKLAAESYLDYKKMMQNIITAIKK